MYVSRGREPFGQRHPGLWGRDWSKNNLKHSRSINRLKFRLKSSLRGRRREEERETAREGGRRSGTFPFFLTQIPPSPSPFNACHVG